MENALLFTVRFYEGRYHGLDNRKAAEWPPAPARLFQAIMAGSAQGATVPQATATALDWLEQLSPPVIAAPPGILGQAFTSYVPNNDLDAELAKGKAPNIDNAVAAIRIGKSIRPTLFDHGTPILYFWFFNGGDKEATTLAVAANRLYQLGRGVDLAWAQGEVTNSESAKQRMAEHGGILYTPLEGGGLGRELLCPRPGLRSSLVAHFDGMRTRFRPSGDNRRRSHLFVQPPRPRLAKVAYNAERHRFLFELREPSAKREFATWQLKSVTDLVQAVRNQAASSLCDKLPDLADKVELYLVGREAQDSDKAKRVQIVPIPSIGHEHADLGIRRLAVYVPQSCPLGADDLAWAFAQVAWVDADGVIFRELQSTDDRSMAERFETSSQHWRSVTPLALPMAERRRIDPDHKLEEAKGANERMVEEARACAAVRQALRHAGVTAPPANISVQREPYDSHGVRAELFAAGTRFSKHALWHAEIAFPKPIAGPLLLGNGRFLGLGLMRPRDETRRDVVAFAIAEGLTDAADADAVALAARRAMMARLQRHLGPNQKLPGYASGHEEGGSPARDGLHRHIAVVADLPRRRILYIAPTRIQRHGLAWRTVATDHRRTIQALEGMDILRAAAAGRLALAPIVVDEERDPLFAKARIWESVTDYQVTRHSRKLNGEEALKKDVAMELMRRGWPKLKPEHITVLTVRRGPRGGLTGRLRLAFATAQSGPLLIGATSHKGGGLFVGC